MQITFVNNDGGGATQTVNAPENMTVEDFIRQHMGHFSSGRHQVRVNRENAEMGDVLENGDHVAVMPTKVGGGI